MAGRPKAGRPKAGRPQAGRPKAGRPEAGRPKAGPMGTPWGPHGVPMVMSGESLMILINYTEIRQCWFSMKNHNLSGKYHHKSPFLTKPLCFPMVLAVILGRAVWLESTLQV